MRNTKDNEKDVPQNQSDSARRKLLKSVAVSSGVAATAYSLPDVWTKPVLNTVVLPAHAVTSEVAGDGGETPPTPPEPMPITGVFQSNGNSGITMNPNIPGQTPAPQFALLNALVPPAHSNGLLTTTICGDFGFTFTITLRLNASGVVDISVGEFFIGDGIGNCGGTSSITDTTIADASIPLGNDEGPECTIDLSGMVASESQVTGTWTLAGSGNNSGCAGSFTAPLGGTFPSVLQCAGTFVEPPIRRR